MTKRNVGPGTRVKSRPRNDPPSSTDAVLVLDPTGRVTAANRVAVRRLHRRKSDVIGQALGRLYPQKLARAWKRMLRSTVQACLPVREQLEHDERVLDSSILPVLAPDGSVERAMLVYRDVTEDVRMARRAAQLAEEWEQTFNSVSDIVTLISPTHELLRVNRAGYEALGTTEEALIGKKCYEVVHHTECPVDGCPCQKALSSKKALSGEFSEHGRHFIATAAPILDPKGNVVAFTHTVKDITYRKRAEDELARHRERLAELVDERTRELREAQEELIRKGKLAALGRVAGGLAREMQAPLGTIRTSAEEIRSALPVRPGPQALRGLSSIESEVDRMELALSSIRDFARRAESRPAGCSLAGIMNRALSQARLPEDVSVHVELPEGLPRVYADERRMVAVFANLLANAAQAMPEGGAIDVYASEQDGRVIVAVSDTGTGMTPELTGRLFEPLFSTRESGAGLGLAVAKAFVEADGGTITLRTQPGKGTMLLVALTIAPPVKG